MRNLLKRFWKEEDGVVAVELLMMIPILVWALLSTYVYFEAFRVEATHAKASITIADLFSREDQNITPEYIDGAHRLLRILSFEDNNPDLRVTVYTFDKASNEYVALWSESRGFGGEVLDSVELNNVSDRLPTLEDREQNILVEVRTDYSAPIRIGLGIFEVLDLQDLTYLSFTVTRPREEFLCWDADSIDTTNDIICNIDDLPPPPVV